MKINVLFVYKLIVLMSILKIVIILYVNNVIHNINSNVVINVNIADKMYNWNWKLINYNMKLNILIK